MIENITQTPNGTYRATIDGQLWTIPADPSNRHFQMVQEAIAEGAEVTVEQPPAPPVPNLTFAQLLIGLVSEGWITATEGRAWRDRVALPIPVQTLIATLPPEQQFIAETRAIAPSEILRADPLVASLGASQGKTPEELDQFFVTYSQV